MRTQLFFIYKRALRELFYSSVTYSNVCFSQRSLVILFEMELLNALAKTSSLPVKSLKELELHKQYAINDAKKGLTKYGEKVKLTLENSFIVYLPFKLNNYLIENQEAYDTFVNDIESKQVFLKYLGNFVVEFV